MDTTTITEEQIDCISDLRERVGKDTSILKSLDRLYEVYLLGLESNDAILSGNKFLHDDYLAYKDAYNLVATLITNHKY